MDRGGESWRAERMDEALTEEEFYGGPLRGILSSLRRRGVLQGIQTLILDEVSAPADVLHEIICDDQYRVKILSLIGSRNLNEGKLIGSLKYAIRPTRPSNTPSLKGLYIFGMGVLATREIESRSSNPGITRSQGAQLGASLNARSQRALIHALTVEENVRRSSSGQAKLSTWAPILKACAGIIAFDTVLCCGPRHQLPTADTSPEDIAQFLPPAIASFMLRGCEICHSAPEGFAIPGKSPIERLPLLSPVPKHSSKVQTAQMPFQHSDSHNESGVILRCSACVSNRLCDECGRFWCEDHYKTKTTNTHMQQIESREGGGTTSQNTSLKVHLGLCTEFCLVEEMYGAGGGGMWG